MISPLRLWHRTGSCVVALCLATAAFAADECADKFWQPGQFEDDVLALRAAKAFTSLTKASGPSTASSASAASTLPVVPFTSKSIISTGDVTAGEVNCRYSSDTEDMEINYYTCTALANKFGITTNKLFLLNPDLETDCSNIKADTEYCVAGFIEPLRATEGLCGPPNGNATCLGTGFQCCNSKTFKCGTSEEDCAAGICYEGDCPGDSVYTTNGRCGHQHGYKQCAGVWGDCCNAQGQCGTGADYCGYGVCQLGNCNVPAPNTPPGPPAWVTGNTTDGTCGGPNDLTCSVAFGRCCNKDGMCGSLPSDCGIGCQPQYGNCTLPGGPSSSSTSVSVTRTTSTGPSSTSIPGLADLPSCGQLCVNNMLAQYSELGCEAFDGSCLCDNPDFTYSLHDCSHEACGEAIANEVIAFGSAYCSAASATTAP